MKISYMGLDIESRNLGARQWPDKDSITPFHEITIENRKIKRKVRFWSHRSNLSYNIDKEDDLLFDIYTLASVARNGRSNIRTMLCDELRAEGTPVTELHTEWLEVYYGFKHVYRGDLDEFCLGIFEKLDLSIFDILDQCKFYLAGVEFNEDEIVYDEADELSYDRSVKKYFDEI